MPLFVEMMIPEWTYIRVCLVVALVVDTLEQVRAQFVLFGFKAGERGVNLKVCLATPGKMAVMFNFMWSIALYAPRLLKTASKSSMVPLSAIIVLWNIRIYICTINSGNEAADIEIAVDEHLGY